MAMAITVNDIKKMPLKAKIGAVAVVLFLIAYFYWFLFLSSAMAKKSSLSQKLTTMEEQIKEKSKVASQLSKYKAEVAALQENYKIALQKLPDQREIPSLFHSVAMAGKEAGIEFLLFEPKASVPGPPAEAKATKTSDLLKPSDQRLAEKENKAVKGTDDKKAGGKKEPEPEPFYEEIPVEVSVLGSFQNTLYFLIRLPNCLGSSISLQSLWANKKKQEEVEVPRLKHQQKKMQ